MIGDIELYHSNKFIIQSCNTFSVKHSTERETVREGWEGRGLQTSRL
jgi:hypothetical protein